MDSVYREWEGEVGLRVGGGGGWEVKGGFLHTLEQKSSHCVIMEVQKGAQCTCQTEKAVGSSFTPSVALLVRLSGTVHPTLDCHGFTKSQIHY